MIRKILVGLDGSEFSVSAVDLGIGWARHFGAELVGLGIIDEPTIVKGEPIPIGGAAFKHHRDERLLADARRRVEEFLEHFGDRCRESGITWRVLEDVGLPHEQIRLEAQSHDVILLGQQTYFHFETQRRHCETLERVLKSAPRPVVTVPHKLISGSATLIAYDGSLQASRALQLFQSLGLQRSRSVHIVAIGKSKTEARRSAQRALDFLVAHEIRTETHVDEAPAESTAEVLLRWVRELDAELMVMGAYGQPLLREFLLGSVTKTVLRESPIPLFLYH
ncbi:MAG TPA: universal stress protein [Candidatus Binatia bacterium]|nr:universal stress protein [Candidatus Binatia bacterium]